MLWVDRERRYLFTTTVTNLQSGTMYIARWMRSCNLSKKNTTETNLPEDVEPYYATSSRIYLHNSCLQDDLKLEKKLVIKEWALLKNVSFLAMKYVCS